MNTDVIELICEKLGTTVEKLLPAVIEFLTHSNKIGIAVGSTLIATGLALLVIGFIVNRHHDGWLWFLCGTISLLVGVVIFGNSVYCYHMVKTHPTVSAYKEILEWISRGG